MKRPFLLLFAAAGLVLPGTAAAEQPIEAVMAAMELDMELIPSSSIDTQGSSATMFDVRSSLGVISPYNAPTFGLMSTGNVNNIEALEDYDYPGSGPDTSAGDRAAFSFDIEVPEYANSFSFNFYFLSREYPEWVGSAYNDTFEVHLQSEAYNGQIVFDAFGNPVTVNNALFTVTDAASLSGTGFDADGGTGWVTTIAPCSGGETMHIEFEIYDVADGVWDSSVLVDNFQFSEDDPPNDGPWTGDDTPDVPIEVAFLSPKEGDLEGGYEVLVHGSGFDNTTSIEIAGVTHDPNSVTVGTGGETLVVEDWPSADAEGSVDIVIRKGLEQVALANGFTYWDESGGSIPPRVTAVMPSEALPDAPTELTIRGVGLDSDATVVFRKDGEDIPATDVSVHDIEGGQEIFATTPETTGGWADLIVVNNDGLESDPGYPFLFTEDAAPPPATGGTQRGPCNQGTGGVAAPLTLLFGLFGIAAVARRRE